MSIIQKRIQELGLTLPEASAPVANYVPFVQIGALIYISGQIARDAKGTLYLGKLGKDVTTEDGKKAAQQCGLNLIAHLQAACGGNLDKVTKIVKLNGFVNSTDDFKDHPTVINGASDLMVSIFGDIGRHARAAVGVSSLPLGVSVEIEGIFEIKEA